MATTNPNTFQVGQLQADFDATATVKSTGQTMQCPVRMGLKKDGSDLWLFPIEPLVSITGGKTVIRRNIAKAQGMGTVKEQWNQDDDQITVTGILMGDGAYPEADVSRLKSFLKVGQSVVIRAKVLDVWGINLICITNYNIPETPGLENQRFSFSGYSDQYFDLT
ncbi:DUF6046 domain-containing protein [Spirosoma aerolatum]|uniref:DUF6046 domain-containing protein n=1 Tax=Spirosoma aerolatum TaxID=1211326 RepID=UPI0009AE0DBA|nr:DUF6046 domain-containing protein [Spirosoma aerolatum]